MDHLDPAGGRAGTGAHKAGGIDEHLGGLGPPFIIGGGEPGGGQDGHDLEGGVPYGFGQRAICVFLP